MPKKLLTRKKSAVEASQDIVHGPLPQEFDVTVNKVGQLLKAQRQDAIRTARSIGKVILAAIEEHASHRGSLYGTRIVEQIAEKLECSPDHLRMCIQLARDLLDDEFERLISLRNITLGHLKLVVSMPEPSQRYAYLEQASENEWSTHALSHRIMSEYGNRRPGSGRRPGVPKSLAAGMSQCETHSKKFLRRLDEVLFGGDFDLANEIKSVPPDRVTADFRQQLAHDVELLSQIAESSSRRTQEMQNALDWVDQVLARQSQNVIEDRAG